MAVTPTGAIYKSLTFDGEDSRDFGVYITGEAVFNAPEREVEMVTIPGRSGLFPLDGGRFENIEVSYPAGLFADTEANFAEAISEFRNMLCSKRGYVRLQDDYHPAEYRMAIYKSGLEVTPAPLKAGEFEIVFDCKPQRHLTSGETEITVECDDIITNPTRFASSPLLAVKGYGELQVGDYSIELQNSALGAIRVLPNLNKTGIDSSWVFPSALVNAGNPEYIERVGATAVFQSSKPLKSAEVTASSGWVDKTCEVAVNGLEGYLSLTMNNLEYATADSSKNCSVDITFTATDDTTTVVTFGLYAIYDRAFTTGNDLFRIRAVQTDSGGFVSAALNASVTLTSTEMTAVSTASALGNPTYIDCELGEAYKVLSGRKYSLNSYVSIGAKLPELKPGANEISFDNTITEVKMTPRWWKI